MKANMIVSSFLEPNMHKRNSSLFSTLLLILTMILAPTAQAQSGAETTRITISTESECEGGPSNKQWAVSMISLFVGTLVVGGVGITTLSRSLAGGGYRQSAANMAGMSLGVVVGGIASVGILASSPCGLFNLPGGISAAALMMGVIVMFFSLVTGKSR